MVVLNIMKDRKKKAPLITLPPPPSRPCFFYAIFLLCFSGVSFSTLSLLFKDGFRPRVVSSTWNSPAMKIVSGEAAAFPAVVIRETVVFPDQALVFLKYPPSSALFTKDDIDCIYFSTNDTSSQLPPQLKLSPISTDDDYFGSQIVRCPLPPRGMIVSLAVKSNGKKYLPAGPMLRWDSLAYEAVIDQDNTTIVFAKGLNLRGGRTSDPTKFKCVYGSGLGRPNFVSRSDVISIAQEIVRCKTPSSILNNPQRSIDGSVKVSIRVVGLRTLESIARPAPRFAPDLPARKMHKMCACTMLRNQARFLREWVMYHGHIGVQRWFIYDNNSDDDIENVIESLVTAEYNVTRHVWPWVKTQEAGFAHCALRARNTCEWVGFIDVDEFFHFPSGLSLNDILENQTRNNTNVGAIRSQCHNFGPSGMKRVPARGVTVGYTCRVSGFERHKSIIKPEALNSTLINVVHHFDLKSGYESVTMSRRVMVINHYKYQVWEVFKDKFYRRVATYVSDWQQDRSVGSKDRAPGLGTKAIEPPDWSTRFCEITDTGLRNRVLETFTDPKTGFLPWQDQPDEQYNEATILL